MFEIFVYVLCVWFVCTCIVLGFYGSETREYKDIFMLTVLAPPTLLAIVCFVYEDEVKYASTVEEMLYNLDKFFERDFLYNTYKESRKWYDG